MALVPPPQGPDLPRPQGKRMGPQCVLILINNGLLSQGIIGNTLITTPLLSTRSLPNLSSELKDTIYKLQQCTLTNKVKSTLKVAVMVVNHLPPSLTAKLLNATIDNGIAFRNPGIRLERPSYTASTSCDGSDQWVSLSCELKQDLPLS